MIGPNEDPEQTFENESPQKVEIRKQMQKKGCPEITFWKTARGDHMITAAIVTSTGLTILIALTAFSGLTGFGAVYWCWMSMVAGAFVPLTLAPREWIDYSGKIPVHTFWKELLS
jgi:hypothetical protein